MIEIHMKPEQRLSCVGMSGTQAVWFSHITCVTDRRQTDGHNIVE